jgi:catechol 2,3-dioxygenase-like lactoylglutathione lyase family enzyme
VKPVEIKGPLGRAVTFVDGAGNITRYLRLSDDAGQSGLGPRLKSLQDSGQQKASSPVVGYELLVSDLAASRLFYADVLGLTIVATGPDSVVFDTGNLLLTLKRETSSGMVSAIKETGKLGDDLVNFHRPNVQATFLELRARGVRFPRGIEDSNHGRVAAFEDPDGHTLAIWQPPPRTPAPDVNYFPVLDRILAG